MARDVERASLYTAPINLWVEDVVTRAYLDALRGSPLVRFLIGGGNEGVLAIVNDAEKSSYPNVFAVIDRDFRRTNRANWSDPAKKSRRFILPVHEIENYLLDAPALADCRLNNRNKTADEIESMMLAEARRFCWWAACRDVVAEMRRRFREGFLEDPSRNVQTQAQARDHICRSPWLVKLPHEIGRTTEADIHQLLDEAYQKAEDALANGSWRTEFAGKEIFHHVGSRICDFERAKLAPEEKAQFHEDLAKEVGAWQRDSGNVPEDLTELLAALRQRIAPPPAGPRPGW